MTSIIIAAFIALQTAVTPATIEGIVRNTATGDGLAQAQVTLANTTGSGSPISAMTDAGGRFVVRNAPPGSYRVFVMRNGFTPQQYGQRSTAARGTILNIAAGQNLKDIDFRMTPAATIIGRVTDAGGEPLAMSRVQLWRSTYDEKGKRRLVGTTQATTDDRGEYRLFWIPAGRYAVSAAPPVSMVQQLAGMQNQLGAPKPEASAEMLSVLAATNQTSVVGSGYSLTYYPGTADVSRASLLEVKPGAELAVDIRMDRQPTFRVAGRVIDTSGRPPRTAEIFLSMRGPGSGESRNATYDPATGRFEVRDVTPGQYVVGAIGGGMVGMFATAMAEALAETDASTAAQLRATAANTPAPDIAQSDVDVSTNIEDIVLKLGPGFSIRGEVRVLGTASLDKLRVGLASTADEEPWSFSMPVPISPDGKFTIKGIHLGSYRAFVSDLPDDAYVRSAHLGTNDVLNGSVIITEEPSDVLRIEIGLSAGRVEGTISDKDGRAVESVQVILVPDNRERRDLFRSATSSPDGRFNLRSVPPGNYKLFAVNDMEANSWFDPEVLAASEQQAKAITISESATVQVDLKVVR